ncbi:helix-turn-helix transcriptional regulator [Bacteroidia bacterium]|nr:helix-turn-helix transcriptional regulator [Bacteroidia bacterium]
MKTIIIADNQDITNAGIRYLCNRIDGKVNIVQAKDKKELISLLQASPGAVVVLDYTLYDFASVEELLILHERFKPIDWVLFSDDLSLEFMRQTTFRSNSFSILLKDCPMEEIEAGLRQGLQSGRYICNRVAGLLSPKRQLADTGEHPALTSTEWEILKLIALGKSTKEIAEERFSSIHTITTHRKNIFRKIEVNNVHEATKYALRAGIIDLAEYYI